MYACTVHTDAAPLQLVWSLQAQVHPNDKQNRHENKVTYTHQIQLGHSELLVEICK